MVINYVRRFKPSLYEFAVNSAFLRCSSVTTPIEFDSQISSCETSSSFDRDTRVEHQFNIILMSSAYYCEQKLTVETFEDSASIWTNAQRLSASYCERRLCQVFFHIQTNAPTIRTNIIAATTTVDDGFSASSTSTVIVSVAVLPAASHILNVTM